MIMQSSCFACQDLSRPEPHTPVDRKVTPLIVHVVVIILNDCQAAPLHSAGVGLSVWACGGEVVYLIVELVGKVGGRHLDVKSTQYTTKGEPPP